MALYDRTSVQVTLRGGVSYFPPCIRRPCTSPQFSIWHEGPCAGLRQIAEVLVELPSFHEDDEGYAASTGRPCHLCQGIGGVCPAGTVPLSLCIDAFAPKRLLCTQLCHSSNAKASQSSCGRPVDKPLLQQDFEETSFLGVNVNLGIASGVAFARMPLFTVALRLKGMLFHLPHVLSFAQRLSLGTDKRQSSARG